MQSITLELHWKALESITFRNKEENIFFSDATSTVNKSEFHGNGSGVVEIYRSASSGKISIARLREEMRGDIAWYHTCTTHLHGFPHFSKAFFLWENLPWHSCLSSPDRDGPCSAGRCCFGSRWTWTSWRRSGLTWRAHSAALPPCHQPGLDTWRERQKDRSLYPPHILYRKVT